MKDTICTQQTSTCSQRKIIRIRKNCTAWEKAPNIFTQQPSTAFYTTKALIQKTFMKMDLDAKRKKKKKRTYKEIISSTEL
jgi:hypothetical protein